MQRSQLSSFDELSTPEARAIYEEVQTMIDERDASKKARAKAHKSLMTLTKTTPHLDPLNPQVPPEVLASLRVDEGPLQNYRLLSMDEVEQHLQDYDAKLGIAPSLPAPTQPAITPQDLALRNPHSVYNWLRQHKPEVFLQDGEGSEKSSGKPGALRGAGKRASIPAPTRPDVLEFVEEDGTGYEALAPTTTKGKRKRDPDEDGGYHPKSGHVKDGRGKKRQYIRRKKPNDESTTPTTTKRGKGKGKAVSPPNPVLEEAQAAEAA